MTQDSIVKVTIGYGPTSLSMMKGTGTNEIWIIIGLNESSDDDDHDDNYWAYGKT